MSTSRLREFRRSRWWTLLVRPVLFLVVSLVIARVLISLVGSVDWRQVGTALRQLGWAQVPALLALLALRQVFNAVPLAVFVPGLGFVRAIQNDSTANLVATVAPPPGDVLARASMFRSWGISPADAMPGVTLNSLVFYVIRFTIPILGVLVLLRGYPETAQAWSAVLSLIVAVAIVIALVLVSRGERFARLLGRQAARVAARFRDNVDAEAWEEAVSGFRARMSTRLTRGLPLSLAALAAMVVTDGVIALVCLRMVGVDSALISAAFVLGSFFLAFPITALPLAGLGVLDATLIVAYTEMAGVDAEPEIVAGLVVWRVVTLIGPLVLGGITFGWWTWQTNRGRLPSGDATARVDA